MNILRLPLAILALTACAANAFDGSKKGFVIGFGIGGHATFIQEKTSLFLGDYRTSGPEGGIATDFLIGYGFTPGFLLMYQNSNSWYSVNRNIFYDAIGPVGIRFYTDEDEPGLFFGASAFLGSFVNTTKNAGAIGPGFGAGIGYEFHKHYSIEARWAHLDAKDGSFTHTSNSLQVLLEALAF